MRCFVYRFLNHGVELFLINIACFLQWTNDSVAREWSLENFIVRWRHTIGYVTRRQSSFVTTEKLDYQVRWYEIARISSKRSSQKATYELGMGRARRKPTRLANIGYRQYSRQWWLVLNCRWQRLVECSWSLTACLSEQAQLAAAAPAVLIILNKNNLFYIWILLLFCSTLFVDGM